MAIEQTVEIPANRRITLEVPPEVPVGKVILTFAPAVSPDFDATNTLRAKNKAAWEKLRELTKDSKLTVERFLEMKNADRVLEAAIDEHAGNSAP
ncbi:MAG: hypothetical protein LBT68_02935 [Spirochaetales bacterium]|jgi:hypothetical protein|nr:hypothetical protein [Spirochaetales bacterium]